MIEIYSDAATLESVKSAASNQLISGVTTNPSLLKKAGVVGYSKFSREASEILGDKALSLEVLSAELAEMELEALEINSWGTNIYVKIPVTLPGGRDTLSLISRLAKKGVRINVTAVMTTVQIHESIKALSGSTSSIVSIFAGRIADTQIDPASFFEHAIESRSRLGQHQIKLLWASTRQVFDVTYAKRSGADIITMPPELIAKLPLEGKDLQQYSEETVQMFLDDAQAAKLSVF
jgi:transaldolase